jgi:hypothetical protein
LGASLLASWVGQPGGSFPNRLRSMVVPLDRSVDNDPPAAMRYTECKLSPLARDALLADISLVCISLANRLMLSSFLVRSNARVLTLTCLEIRTRLILCRTLMATKWSPWCCLRECRCSS